MSTAPVVPDAVVAQAELAYWAAQEGVAPAARCTVGMRAALETAMAPMAMALIDRADRDLLTMLQQGLSELRQATSGDYAAGLALAEEFVRKMREEKP